MDIITFPHREKMLECLLSVSNDSFLQRNFYPILLELAGQKYLPEGFTTMLVRTANKCIKNVLHEKKIFNPEQINYPENKEIKLKITMLSGVVHIFIDAFVNDEILDFFQN